MKKTFTALCLVTVASGCAFADTSGVDSEAVGIANQHFESEKRASVAYPVQVEQEKDSYGNYPVRRDQRTHLPLKGWDVSHAELLVADEYAQCVSEVAGTDTTTAMVKSGMYPAMGEWSYALGQVESAIDRNPCPDDDYDDGAGGLTYPPSQLEWARRRENPSCNMDSNGNLTRALVLSPYDSTGPLADLLDWMDTQTTFTISGTSLFLPGTAYRIVYYSEINLCLAQRLTSLLEGADTLSLTTREHMLLQGLAYEAAQIAMLKSAYLLQLRARTDDVSQVPATNAGGNATGAYLWHWMNSRPTALQRTGKTFLRALRLTTGAGTAFATFLERQAGARWTTASSSDPFIRDWGGGSARSRLMNLIYGGNALADLWDSDSWIGDWFSAVNQQSSDPRVALLLNLARQADALYLHPATWSVDPISGDEIFVETELALRARYCMATPAECDPAAIRANLPPLASADQYILTRDYGITREHALRLANGLFDAVAVDDLRCNNDWSCTTDSGKGTFHMTGSHQRVTRTDHLGNSGDWLKLDSKGMLISGPYSDKVDWGVHVRTPLVPDWDTTMTWADPEPFVEYANVGIVSALAYARETLFTLESKGKPPGDATETVQATRQLERLLGKTTVMHRPTSTVVLTPTDEPDPTMVVVGWSEGAGRTVKPAAQIKGYASPGGITREALDLKADVTSSESTYGASAFANTKRVVWYPGTPDSGAVWPNRTSYLLRSTKDGEKTYTYLTTVSSPSEMSKRASTVVSSGWFADLERRITAVQDLDWSRPRYDGFGLPVNWVPPADASLMGGSPGEESYQYLLRAARGAAEEATAAVKTAIDKLVEEAQDETALQQAEDRAQAIGGLELKALCGSTELCELPTESVSFENDADTACSEIAEGGKAACKMGIWRANDALRTNWIPKLVVDQLKNSSATFSDKDYAGSELQRVLVRIWNAGRLLNAAKERAVEEAHDYGWEFAAVGDATTAAQSEYDLALEEIEALGDSIIAADATKQKQVEAIEFSIRAAEERVGFAGFAIGDYCEGDIDSHCEQDCYAWGIFPRANCKRDCTYTLLSKDPKTIYDACLERKGLEHCGKGAGVNFGESPNNTLCRDALNAYTGMLLSQTEVGKTADAQYAALANSEDLKKKQVSAETRRSAALDKKQAADTALGARKSAGWTQLMSHFSTIRQLKGELQSALAELEQLQLKAQQSEARAQLEVDLAAAAVESKSRVRRRFRNYDMWRADALLESARRLAVAARRGIEARFVVDLSTLDAEQAFVSSPSMWADEIYESDLNAPEVVGLAQATEVEGAIYPNKLIDYVGNLERFVQGYTMTYPTSVSLPDTEVITLGAPDQVAAPNQSGVSTIAPDAAGWRFYCAAEKQWVAHPGTAQYPLTSRLDTVCSGKPPSLAKYSFWLDSWGTLNGAWTRPQYVDRHNVRWRRLAVNLVGTGIRECAKASDPMSCYTNPYVRFDLMHNGPSWQTNHAGEWRALDITTAHVEAGKALAAEEWLEPVSNSWNMPYVANVARGELFGRPAAGGYELVLEITPDVRLDRIERIQLLVEQDYWVKQTGGRGVYDERTSQPVAGLGGSAGAPGSTATSSGGSSGSGGTTGTSTTAAGGATSTTGTTNVGYSGYCAPVANDLPIEDFDDGDKIIRKNAAERLGVWYGFHAGTCAASPATAASFVPSSGTNGSAFIGHADGSGCTFSGTPVWHGGGIGFNFLSSYVNGVETVCANYNASSYTGIAFDAQGSGQIRMEVCTSDHADLDKADCHGAFFTVNGTWTRYQARWSDLSQRGWGTTIPFNSSHVRKLQFLSVEPNYNFNIDNIAFINN